MSDLQLTLGSRDLVSDLVCVLVSRLKIWSTMAVEPTPKRQKTEQAQDDPPGDATGSLALGSLTALNPEEQQALSAGHSRLQALLAERLDPSSLSELQALMAGHLSAHHEDPGPRLVLQLQEKKKEEPSQPTLAHRAKMPWVCDIKTPHRRDNTHGSKVDEQDIIDTVKMVQDHMWELHKKIKEYDPVKRIVKAGGIVWFNETQGGWKSFACT